MSRVLVADDERGICDAFAAFLTAEGHDPVVVCRVIAGSWLQVVDDGLIMVEPVEIVPHRSTEKEDH